MATSPQVYFVGNDMLIEVLGLKNAETGNAITDATVTVTVQDSTGQPVAGQSWPLTLPHASGSNGDYRATLEKALSVADGDKLTAVITAVGGGLTAKWERPVTAKTRTT